MILHTLRPKPAFNRTPRRRGLRARTAAVAAISRLTSKGTITGKEDFVQSVLKLAMVGQKIRERSVLIEGDIALIFGTAELRFADPGKEEAVQDLRYTATYVKRQGQWRMLALQMQQRAPK